MELDDGLVVAAKRRRETRGVERELLGPMFIRAEPVSAFGRAAADRTVVLQSCGAITTSGSWTQREQSDADVQKMLSLCTVHYGSTPMPTFTFGESASSSSSSSTSSSSSSSASAAAKKEMDMKRQAEKEEREAAVSSI